MKNKGFTLIELVVVIVILGVLAVTAAPRFLNLQTDARDATLDAMKGTIQGTINVTYGKLAIDGLENEQTVLAIIEPEVAEWCDGCYFTYGVPANHPTTWMELIDDVGGSDSDFVLAGGIAGYPTSTAFAFPTNVDGSNQIIEQSCYVRYTPPGGGSTEYELEVVPCN